MKRRAIVFVALMGAACTTTQGQQAGRTFGVVDKVVGWLCRAWPTVRAGANTILPNDATDGMDASAPSSGGSAP